MRTVAYVPDEVWGRILDDGSRGMNIELVADVGWIGAFEVVFMVLGVLFALLGLVAVVTSGFGSLGILIFTLVPITLLVAAAILGRFLIRRSLAAFARDVLT
jgi:hypothetical protein